MGGLPALIWQSTAFIERSSVQKMSTTAETGPEQTPPNPSFALFRQWAAPERDEESPG